MKQAIVLAAGLGSRLRELTKSCPKPLLPVNNVPILERNINFMVEAGLKRAVIVVGYMSDKFQYLPEQYKDQIEIVLVQNGWYRDYNTLSSMYFASPYFTMDSYIVTGDLYLLRNIYSKYNSEHNFYLHLKANKLEKPEWAAKIINEQIVSVNKSAYSGSIYTGVSYWPKEDLKFIKKLIDVVDWNGEQTKVMFWDELLFSQFNTWPVYVKHCDKSDLFEIDDQDDLQKLKEMEGDETLFGNAG